MILNDNISLMGLDLFSINDFLVDEFLEFLQDEPFKTWKSNTLKAHKLNAYAKHPRKCKRLLNNNKRQKDTSRQKLIKRLFTKSA